MVSCYPRINACRMGPWQCGVRHVPERSVVADSMKFIDSLVGNTATLRNELLATGRKARGMRCPPEISINCDRHHGMPRRGSHYLHHGWGQPEFNAFVPQLWWADEAEPPHRRYLWLQRAAHVWLQSMRGMGHGRKYRERSARRNSRCAGMA